jgi:hypothetical protein
MKSFVLSLLLLSCLCCFADDTNIIAMSDWSEPVGFDDHAIRGRLLIVAGSEPAYGGPKTENLTMTFVELQNVTGACCGSVKVYFDIMGLNSDLFGANGVPFTSPLTGDAGFPGPSFSPCWVVLPYNSTIRLFVDSTTRSSVRIHPNGEIWRRLSISPSDTNVYYLSATLTISTPTNGTLTVTPPGSMGYHKYADWSGKLIFPKTKIFASKQ